MKIVIVEDEKRTRLGLENIIRKMTSHEVAASVSDGVEGLKTVMELSPDVVITDIKMPNMDGLTMLEKIREQGGKTRAILLTGFSEFEYARKSVQLEAEDYLLKPLNVDEILEVLEKTEKKIARTRTETVSEEQLVFSLLNGEQEEKMRAAEVLEHHLKLMNGEKTALFLVRAGSRMETTVNEMTAVLKERLASICMQDYHVFPMLERRAVLVMIMEGQRVHYLKELFRLHILPMLQNIGECMAAYEELERLDELSEKLDQMTARFEYGFGCGGGVLLDREYIEAIHFETREYPERLEQLIKKAVRNGTEEDNRKIAGQFQDEIIENKLLRPSVIREYTLRFGMAAANAASEQKKNGELEKIYHILLNGIMECDTREQLLYVYHKIWDSILAGEEEEVTTENSIVLHVLSFIRQNYAQDISLSGAAEAVGVSPEYLSRLFTKEMGINFSTFLGDFRISMAKRLLADEKYRIYEVAEAVGFRDTKYFNKVFRSVTGISPSDYRKTMK